MVKHQVAPFVVTLHILYLGTTFIVVDCITKRNIYERELWAIIFLKEKCGIKKNGCSLFCK